MLQKKFLIYFVSIIGLLFCSAASSDNVDELIELFRIKEETQAQYQECLDSSSKSVESELGAFIESGELGIEPGDEDWALLIAIYAEYYNTLCDYLSGDEILNFYRSELKKRFTPDEIDSLIEFHSTPIGKKLTDEWFEINRVYGRIMGERQLVDSRKAQIRFEQRMEDFWRYREEKLSSESQEQDA